MKNILLIALLVLIPSTGFAETIKYKLEEGETIQDVREEYGDVWIYDYENDPTTIYIEVPNKVEEVVPTDVEMFQDDVEVETEEQIKVKLMEQIIQLLIQLIELQTNHD